MSYLVVLDKATVGSSNAVALDFGRALFGPVGGVVFAVFVAVSCFGALNGSIFAQPAIANDSIAHSSKKERRSRVHGSSELQEEKDIFPLCLAS